ncbi:MAG TPA: FAD-binding oxidoreductase, partial [Roseiflexaceae bacterium]|nr:FAD-binding oxidoreductase [Roseiflexaceae bacterium]
TAALALARRGARVVLLEAKSIGWGASSRNGGMVLSGLKLDAVTLLKRYGRERARRMFAASLAAIDLVAQIVAEEQIDCSFVRSGHLLVAVKRSHAAGLVAEAEILQREFDHAVQVVPQHMLHEEIGSAIYHGGLVDPMSAAIDPARYTAGLAAAALRRGAQLVANTPVQHVAGQPGAFRLTTPRGVVQATAVLAATAGYTGAALPALQRRIVPLGSYCIATEPLPDDLAQSGSPRNRMIFDSKHFLSYYRLTPDQRMLFGGRAGFFPETPTTVRESAALLQRGMLAVFPQLRGVQVAYAWGGTLDVCFDMMPHAGKLAGLSYACGYAGHGVAMATMLGTILGTRLAGGAAENPFEGLEPPQAPLGLYDGRPWFLPLAGIWYRILDILT